MSELRATLRLQFHRGFRFADALPLLPYIQALGISHIYASPVLRARSGSTHGYDCVDPRVINPELGGEPALRELAQALRARKMGLVLDIVPNHMAVGEENPWWMDVLEWGMESRYANFFDIDWDADDPLMKRRVLVPFLGKPVGEALDDGELSLRFENGRLYIAYFDHRFPVAAREYAALLRLQGEGAAGQSDAFRAAVQQKGNGRHESFERACTGLSQVATENPEIAKALASLCQHFTADSPEGRARLERLLDRQHYRLAWWRTAADEINWRRFFDVTELIGMRTQEPAVFEASHERVLRLYAEGLVDGLRVDHVDGLADPRTYCRLLRDRTDQLCDQRPPDVPHCPAYLVVEKILGPGEKLPKDWEMDGTSGYVFMDHVSALLHDPAGAEMLTETWRTYSGSEGSFDEVVRHARRRIAENFFYADLQRCVHALHQVARMDRRTQDWSAAAIRRVLLELLVEFPVYRTYADADGRSEDDAAVMATAIAAATPRCRISERPLLQLLDQWLGGEPTRKLPSAQRRARLRALARFQQLTSPLAAKSVEDTAFYRHGRLLSRNEVGADPAHFAMSPEDFHAACEERRSRYPRAMLATATHDHKRGEDLRARLAVLSEIPSQWAAAVEHWRQLNKDLRRGVPDPIDEYLLYQMLVGSWPLSLRADDAEGLAAWGERLAGWQQKAVREAKRRSGWTDPNVEYEDGCRNFLLALVDPQRSPDFLRSLGDFVETVAPAGAVNGLSQTLLRLTTPGIPDLYQGTEFWDFSLVDPDNRRPVDFQERIAALAHASPIAELRQHWRDGRIKQRIIARALGLRARLPSLFLEGDYRPLAVHGAGARHLLAFLRAHGDSVALVVAPRLSFKLLQGGDELALAHANWSDTRVALPAELQQRRWRDAFSDVLRDVPGTELSPAQLMAEAPVALWYSER